MARELHGIVVLELEGPLEPLANLLEGLLALLRGPALALANGARPETNTVEASPDVDHDAHDFVVLFVLEVLTDGSEHDVEPERIDVDGLLVLELEGPLATVLVLRVFPLGADALLEEVVVGLERKIRCRCDVVLALSALAILTLHLPTYVNAPELLDRVERDDFLQQLGPVVALCLLAILEVEKLGLRTLPLGGLVNHSVQVFMSGCLTLKFSASWKTVLTSPSDVELVDCSLDSPDELLSSTGEMGMVSRGTC